MRVGLAALTLSAAFLFSTRALAHDYWIEPSTFAPALGVRIDLHLLVGEALAPEEERDADRAHGQLRTPRRPSTPQARTTCERPRSTARCRSPQSR